MLNSFLTHTVYYTCFRTTQSRSFLSKVRYVEGIRDEGTRNLVRNNKMSLYRGFVIQREFTYNLLGRIQGTGLSVRNSGKFVVRGFVIARFYCIMILDTINIVIFYSNGLKLDSQVS